MEKLKTKADLLNKLRTYKETPDDDVIRIKKQIEDVFMECPEILYALNEPSLYNELFDPMDKEHWQFYEKRKINVPTDECRLNWEWNEDLGKYEHLGEWDRYFGSDANIRPFIFIPGTQTDVKHYICYQVSFQDTVKYQPGLKDTLVTFTIFVHGNDRMDKLTGIPRHDLIASILREKFAWSNIFGMQTHLISNRESVTDTNYITRTMVFQSTTPNGIVTTQNGKTSIINYQLRR